MLYETVLDLLVRSKKYFSSGESITFKATSDTFLNNKKMMRKI